MSDIVERLRAPVWPKKPARRELCNEAAAEIERLRDARMYGTHPLLKAAEEEIERLQAALREIGIAQAELSIVLNVWSDPTEPIKSHVEKAFEILSVAMMTGEGET